MSHSVVFYIAVFLVSIAATYGARRALMRLQIVDIPNARSSHTTVVVRGLGFGVCIAAAAGCLALAFADPNTHGIPGTTVALGTLAVAAIGLLEDVRGLSVPLRSLLLLTWALATSFVLIVPYAHLNPLLILYAILFLSSYVNVANFMDGLNGISGFHAVIAGVTFGVCGLISHLPWLSASGFILAASYAGFLLFNLTGKGFLGDIGSYMFGGAVALTSFAALLSGVPFLASIGPMVIYFGDVWVTLVKRIRKGEKWHAPHKEHTYQRIHQLGYSHVRASALTAGFTLACSALGLLAYLFGSALWWNLLLFAAGFALLALYLRLPRILTPVEYS